MNSTVKALNTMTKWDSPPGCKVGSTHAKQLTWCKLVQPLCETVWWFLSIIHNNPNIETTHLSSCEPRKAKDRQKPTEDTRESMALLTPWLQASGLQNHEKINFCCFKPSSLCIFCYSSPRKLIHWPRWPLNSELHTDFQISIYDLITTILLLRHLWPQWVILFKNSYVVCISLPSLTYIVGLIRNVSNSSDIILKIKLNHHTFSPTYRCKLTWVFPRHFLVQCEV